MNINNLDFLNESKEKITIIGGQLFSRIRQQFDERRINENGEITSSLLGDFNISANGLALATTDETSDVSIGVTQISLSSSVSGFAMTPN